MARTSLVHYISPSAITIIPNCNGTSDDLAVQVASGTKIRVYSKAVGLDLVNATYQEWTLKGRNRRLLGTDTDCRYTIFARLSKASVADGYVVFTPMAEEAGEGGATVGRDKYWHVTAEGYSRYEDNRLDEDFDPDNPPIADTDEKKMQKDYWWIRIGWVTKPTGGLRSVYLDTGILGTEEGDETNTEEMMKRKYVTVEWFKRLFNIHGTDGKRVIDHYDADGEPVYDTDEDGNYVYEGQQYDPDTHEVIRRDIEPNDMDHEITDTESMFGTWTQQWLSALGMGSNPGEGGGGGAALEWPLLDINNQGMPVPGGQGGPATGDAIVYDSALNGGEGGFKWGKTGAGLSGLHLYDGATEIQPTVSGDSYTYRLSDNFLSLTGGGTVSGNVILGGASLTIIGRPQDFNPETAPDATVLTKGETQALFAGRFVTVEFFESLFELHTGDAQNTKIDTNADLTTYTAAQRALFNIKAMFGTWTEQYLSALGIGSGGSSGGVSYLSLLEDVSVGTLTPQDNGKALVYDGTLGKWVKGTAGIDTTQLNTILQGKTLTITDGTRQLGSTWNASTGGSIDISGIFTGKKWWNATMSNGVVKGDIQLTGSITPETNASGNTGSDIGSSALRYKAIYVNEIHIGDAVISWNTTHSGLEVTEGMFSDKWLSALGAGSQGGAAGMDWDALTDWDQDSTHVIDKHYLANVTKMLTITNGDGSTTYGTYDGTSVQTIRIPSGITNLSPLAINSGNSTVTTYNPTANVNQTVSFNEGTGIKLNVTTNAIAFALDTIQNLTEGTYRSVTVDSYGRVTAGTNPTTLGDYGITASDTLFADITAGKATQLSDTAAYTAWGQTFFSNGIPVNIPITYTAQMQVTYFTALDNSTRAGYVGRGATANDNIFLTSYTSSSVILQNTEGSLTLDGNGCVGINGTTSATDTKLFVNGNIRTGGNSGNWIQIGQLRLIYEESGGNKFLRLADTTSGGGTANFYATGAVSALGTGSTGGASTFDEDQMWTALGGSMDNKKIANSHLNFNINDYATTNALNTAIANCVATSDVHTLTINGETWNPLVENKTITISASGNYLPLTGGTLTGSLSLGAEDNDSYIDFRIHRNSHRAFFALDPQGVLVIACQPDMSGTGASYGLRMGESEFTWKGYNILHAGNYTTELNGNITNAMLAGNIAADKLAGSIPNSKLSNSSVTVNGTTIALGASGTTSKWGESRNVKIVNSDGTGTGIDVAVDGSGNVALKLPAEIKASLSGNATTATSLSDTATYTAFGQTFFSNGKPVNIPITYTGMMQVTYFTALDGESKAGYVGRGRTTNDDILLSSYTDSAVVLLNTAGSLTLDGKGCVGIGGTTSATDTKLFVNGNIRTAAGNGSWIQIGDIRIVYDNASSNGNNSLKIVRSDGTAANLYATGAVSALGTGSTGGASTFDEEQMWTALGGSMQNKKIANSHLNFDINNYALISQIPSLAGYATEQWVSSNYLPKTGGTISNPAWGQQLKILRQGGTPSLYMSDGTTDFYIYPDITPSNRWTVGYSENGVSQSDSLALLSDLNGMASQDWVSQNYLPLTGGALTGSLSFGTETSTYYTDLRFYRDGHMSFLAPGTDRLTIAYRHGTDQETSSQYSLVIGNNVFTYNGNNILHAGTSYVNSGKGYIGGTEITTISGTAAKATADASGNTITTTYSTIADTVTAIGTSGNDLTWTKNGTTSNITVPYSTKAGSLSDTAAYSAFGQTFFNNGIPVSIPVTATAQMQVAFFTETDGTTKAGYVGRGGTSVNTVFLIGYSGNEVDLGANGNQGHIHINTSGNVGIGTASPTTKLDVSGRSRMEAIDLNGELDGSTYYSYIDFHYNRNTTYTDFTTRLIETGIGVLNVKAAGGNGVTGFAVGRGNPGDYIQIGAIRIGYDDTNGALEVYKLNSNGTTHDAAGLYARGFVSSLGTGSSGGSGGGTLYGLSLTNTTLSLVPDGQQSSVNLSNAIGLYLSSSSYVTGLTINGLSTGISVSNHTINIDNVVRKVKVGTTEYTPLQNGTVELPASTSGSYLPLSGGTMTGSIAFGTETSTYYTDIHFYRNSHMSYLAQGPDSLVIAYRPDINNTSVNYSVVLGNDVFTYNGNTILHAANGVTLSGTQTISGAKTFTSKTSISVGLLTGETSLSVKDTSSIKMHNLMEVFATNMSASQTANIHLGRSLGNKASGHLAFRYISDSNDNNCIGLGVDNPSDSDPKLGLCVYGNKKVYVGGHSDTAPTYTLTVNGTGYFTGNVGVCSTPSGAYNLYVSGTGYFTDKVYIGKNDVYLTYKTVTPTTGTSLNFLNVCAAGLYLNGSPYNSSDIRKKNVEKNLDFGVEDVARAPIFDFTWKTGSDNLVHVGSSAQYWNTILPHAVLDFYDDGLALDYGATALAAAVMTARTVLFHEERIKALEAENERLRTEIELLKAA